LPAPEKAHGGKRRCDSALIFDGCLAQFNASFADEILSVIGDRRWPEGYDTSDPPVWEWPRHFGYTKEEEDRVWQEVWASKYFWHDLDVILGELKSLYLLNDLSRCDGHEIYFITHRKGRCAQWQSNEWLQEHGVACSAVLISQSRNKFPLIQALGLDAYIDDNIDTANDLAREQAEGAIQTRIYLRSTRHNQESRHPGLRVVDSVWEMLGQEGLR